MDSFYQLGDLILCNRIRNVENRVLFSFHIRIMSYRVLLKHTTIIVKYTELCLVTGETITKFKGIWIILQTIEKDLHFTLFLQCFSSDQLRTQLGDCILLSPLVSSWWDLHCQRHGGKQTAWANLMREQPVRVRVRNNDLPRWAEGLYCLQHIMDQ